MCKRRGVFGVREHPLGARRCDYAAVFSGQTSTIHYLVESLSQIVSNSDFAWKVVLTTYVVLVDSVSHIFPNVDVVWKVVLTIYVNSTSY